jgi:intermediate peptidase
MLAQTELQHISGTRVAMDFVEVPSILMESFANVPEVLSFGRHYKTGNVVPLGLLKQYRLDQKKMEAFETQHQIQMAILDQLYHSKLALNSDFNTTSILSKLQDRISPIKSVSNTAWQVQFSHLFSYGASYYSYLVCIVLFLVG